MLPRSGPANLLINWGSEEVEIQEWMDEFDAQHQQQYNLTPEGRKHIVPFRVGAFLPDLPRAWNNLNIEKTKDFQRMFQGMLTTH